MIKLQKDKWDVFKLGEIFKLKSGNALPQSKIVPGNHAVYGGNGIIGYHNSYMSEQPTIVIGRVGEYCGAVYLTQPNSWITDNGLFPTIFFKQVDKYFFKNLLQIINLNKYAQKTGQPSLSQSMLYQIEILLPPFDEQQRIAELFQSIEKSIAHAEKQEENLRWLLQDLINDYTNTESKYRKGTLQKTRFGHLAQNISERVEPKDAVGQVFIGLDHLDPRSIFIKRFGKPDDLIGTKLKMYKGDIIFSKRNAYLRKVAVTNFNGICSAHAMVIRAVQEKINKDFLPYFMHSDSFMQRAKEISEGSISPTIKWKNLEKQEFLIPQIEEQDKIVELFMQIDTTCNLLQNQIQTLKALKQKLLNEILGG